MASGNAGKKRVTFRFRTTPGRRVAVVGSFNDWDPQALLLNDQKGTGLYTRTCYVAAGDHEYKYVVDGQWRLSLEEPYHTNQEGHANHFLPRPPQGETGLPGRVPLSLQDDPYLEPFASALRRRCALRQAIHQRLTGGNISLAEFSSAHEYYGLHRQGNAWAFREWAPNATSITLFGSFCDWDPHRGIALARVNAKGDWEAIFPAETVHHQDLYKLRVTWDGGEGERLPAYTRRVVQDESTKAFDAQVWDPPEPYHWQHARPGGMDDALLIYEAHVGIAQEEPKVGSYLEFRDKILPRIDDAGYNAIQLMALTEHPYYGSFGYHVANFYACSSRFGTPEELKSLIDEAHRRGLRVIMDLVHSHAVKNEAEGLSRFDGTSYQYFHDGARGDHVAWDSRCFDYQKPEVLHFLLSNCRYWLDEFQVDGFRFDGVTSMLYEHHGLGGAFDSYQRYFDESVDEDAYSYLGLANALIHEVHPGAITIAEDVSGMPGLGAGLEEGGCGFDARMAMGVPDHWFRLTDMPDEHWNVEQLWYELTNRRQDERTISYVESHDQALVGGKSFIFELIDAAMYDSMARHVDSLAVDRGVALHKLARLLTVITSDAGYLNFMGNEFGHPEWIDFPREGNGWSYHYARRQWSLRDDPHLRYHGLAEFDRDMLGVLHGAHCLTHAPEQLCVHVEDQVLACARGELVFLFNFHPTRSHEAYAIPVPDTRYTLVLDSDQDRYAGHGRLAESQIFDVTEGHLQAYLPTRTALILRTA